MATEAGIPGKKNLTVQVHEPVRNLAQAHVVLVDKAVPQSATHVKWARGSSPRPGEGFRRASSGGPRESKGDGPHGAISAQVR
jgi:hypothetical protein